MDSTWEKIPSFPMYEVSTDGHIRNTFTHRILEPFFNTRCNAWQVVLSVDGTRHCVLIHRAMAEAFAFNEAGRYRIVTFADGDSSNLNISNLRIVDVDGIVDVDEENSHFSPWPKRVRNCSTGEEWDSVSACAREFDVWPSTISHAIYKGTPFQGCLYEFVPVREIFSPYNRRREG